MNQEKRNVFVIGLDQAHCRDLTNVPDADLFRIHGLLDARELIYLEEYPVEQLLERALEAARAFPEQIHGILGHWDFPVSVMVPILCQSVGVPGPSLESVLKCEHKYWSRLEQRKVAPECTPEFYAVDPFSERPLDQVRLEYPFWIKPVKAYGSALGFKVERRADFDAAIEAAREQIRRFGDPFNRILARIPDRGELGDIGGNHLIAEQLVGQREIALEGFVQRGRVHVHGLIDMVRTPDSKSFERYEYPAQIEPELQQRACSVARRVLEQIGLDDACFNVEFFWDGARDRLWIIEINTRIAQSHSALFALVDGMSNHEVALHVAVGDAPAFSHGAGPFDHAARFLHRRFDTSDACVTHVPDDEALTALATRQPHTRFGTRLRPGMRLSDLLDQDAYSYTLAELDIGAQSPAELVAKYQEAVSIARFGLEPCDS